MAEARGSSTSRLPTALSAPQAQGSCPAQTKSPEQLQQGSLSIAVGIPTRGRPSILCEALANIHSQTRPAEAILVCFVEEADLGAARDLFPGVHYIRGKGGSAEQRNQLLDAAAAWDLIFLQDDDFLADQSYLERTVEVFAQRPEVAGSTGRILQNGARGPGYSVAQARRFLLDASPNALLPGELTESTILADGCNMAFRMHVLRSHALRFDEEMPGYAWYEDIDFSRRLAPFGLLLLIPSAQGVHLGTKQGRTSGRRFGYSQIANPLYLARKGTCSWPGILRGMAVSLLSNLLRSLLPEPYIDRRGRLRGNLLGLWDVVRARSHPRRVLSILENASFPVRSGRDSPLVL